MTAYHAMPSFNAVLNAVGQQCRPEKAVAPSAKLILPMATATVPAPRHGSSALWWGLLITVLGLASNFLYGLPIPQAIIPWINLVVPLIGLIVLLVGLVRIWPDARLWKRSLGVILGLLSAAVFAISVWLFIHVRDVPRSAGAPQVGQKVPDFTLPDSSGQPVSLSQLLSSPITNSARPKALLLVFYRGHW
jgi:hypothetical protein